jgi:hypothetical protein
MQTHAVARPRPTRPSGHTVRSTAVITTLLVLAGGLAGCDAAPLEPAPLAGSPITIGTPDLSRSGGSGTVSAIEPGEATLAVGSSLRLVALDAQANPVQANWSTSASAVATVSDGLVTAGGAGSARITARTKNQNVSITVTVVAPSAPSAPPLASCSEAGALRQVAVGNASQLAGALRNALPGDRIVLADGTYRGYFSTQASGTEAHPVRLCGSATTVIDGGSVFGGVGLLLEASHWVVEGLRVTNAQFGVVVRRGHHNVLRGLEVHGIGYAGVHFGWNSTYNSLENSRVHDTGRDVAEYGEGVYLGSFNGHWCQRTSCQPDRSDYNRVVGNTIGPDVRSEAIDIKEGTTGGVITHNTFLGAGMVASQTWVDSWVEVKGNGYLISDNRGDTALRDGFQVFRQIEGWGNGNVFRNNVADVQASGYGFRVGAGTTGNRIECVNSVRNAASGFANVACIK